MGPKLKDWQKVVWIFLFLLFALLRMAQTQYNPNKVIPQAQELFMLKITLPDSTLKAIQGAGANETPFVIWRIKYQNNPDGTFNKLKACPRACNESQTTYNISCDFEYFNEANNSGN